MSIAEPSQNTEARIADPRWKDLYRIGFIASVAFPVMIAVAVVIYVIWPYTPGTTSIEDIFTTLNNDRIAGLMSLDFLVLLFEPVMILQLIALYGALKRVNESYALIALVLGLVGVVLWLMARPLAELIMLSDQYALATSEDARSHYLAAGEALHALFDGTSWILSQFFISTSYVVSSLLMLRSKLFTKATAYVGLIITLPGLCFWIPGIGAILSLLATIFGVAWYLLMARDFYRLGWRQPPSPQAAR